MSAMRSAISSVAERIFAIQGARLDSSCTSASRDKGGCPSCGQQGCEDGILPDAKKDQPNRETIAAMLEAERVAKDPSVRGYDDLDEAFAELKK